MLHQLLELLENPYVSATVILVLIMYGSMAKPELPPAVQRMFTNPIFQILLFSLIVYRGNHNPQVAIMIAVVFMIVMNLITEQNMRESVQQAEQFQGSRYQSGHLNY